MIKCRSIKGNWIEVPKEKLVFRPSVYAIIIHDGKVLMLNNKSNSKLFFPGGGVNIGEKMMDALRREVKEEVGLEIEIGKFVYFKEHFFYYDPEDSASHRLSFFYLCEPKTFDLLADEDVDDEEAEKPRWIDMERVRANPDNIEAVDEVFEILSRP